MVLPICYLDKYRENATHLDKTRGGGGISHNQSYRVVMRQVDATIPDDLVEVEVTSSLTRVRHVTLYS